MDSLIKDINHDLGDLLQFTFSAYDRAVEITTNTMRACSIIIAPHKKNVIQLTSDPPEDIAIVVNSNPTDEQWHVVQEPEWTYEQFPMVRAPTCH
jgi:hypothetical protein